MPKNIRPTIFMILLAIITLLPIKVADKVSALGYHSFCSFAPISTIILLAVGGILFFTSRKKNTDDDVEM